MIERKGVRLHSNDDWMMGERNCGHAGRRRHHWPKTKNYDCMFSSPASTGTMTTVCWPLGDVFLCGGAIGIGRQYDVAFLLTYIFG